MDKSV